jgi:hypothetical protein
MKRALIIFVILIVQFSSLFAGDSHCRYYKSARMSNAGQSLHSKYFTYNSNGKYFVVNKKTGIPVIPPPKLESSCTFDESDSSFFNSVIDNGVYKFSKYDAEGNKINEYYIPDTLPQGNTFLTMDPYDRPYTALYSLNKLVLNYYDLENQKKIQSYSFPSQEAWDVVQGATYSYYGGIMAVTYPYFYIFYNIATGDSLFTIDRSLSYFAGFNNTGKYFFLKDSLGITVCDAKTFAPYHKWIDPAFRNTSYMELADSNRLLLSNGDTLNYLDTSKAFVHRNNRNSTRFELTYIGDTLYFFDTSDDKISVYDFDGNFAFTLNNEWNVPFLYSLDESTLLSIHESGYEKISYSSSSNGFHKYFGCFERMFLMNDILSFDNRLKIESNLQYLWESTGRKITKKDIMADSVTDEIKCDFEPYLVRFNQLGSFGIVQDTSGLAQVVDLTAKTVGTPFKCPDGVVQISPDGSTFIAIENYIINNYDYSKYKGYSVYKTSTGEKIFSTSGFNSGYIGYGSLAYSPDSHTIAIADSTDSLKIYSLPDGALIRKIKLEWTAPTTLNFTPDGKNLVYSSENGSVAAFDFVSGKTIWRYNDIKDETIIRVVISPKGKYVTAMSRSYTLAEWEPDWNASPLISVDETPAPVNTVKITPHPVLGISRLEFTSALLGSGKVEIFAQTGERIASIAFEKPARTCETEIDMSGMPAGVYVYRITVSGREISTGAISKF